ncbi:MAG: RHS repeat-associated protein [Glaciecola sp.]
MRSNNAHSVDYLHKDHLGSINFISDDEGRLKHKLSFDAFGKRRDGATWSPIQNVFASPSVKLISKVTERGFTGHEHVDHANIIHMNGRIYDPETARFAQADPIVQAPENGQSLNRYSYVFNNPLSYTDPTGYTAATEQGGGVNFFKQRGKVIREWQESQRPSSVGNESSGAAKAESEAAEKGKTASTGEREARHLPFLKATYPNENVPEGLEPTYIDPASLQSTESEWEDLHPVETSILGAAKGTVVYKLGKLLGLPDAGAGAAGAAAAQGALTENFTMERQTTTYTATAYDWKGSVYFSVFGNVKAIDFESLSDPRPVTLEITQRFRVKVGDEVVYTSWEETISINKVENYIPAKAGSYPAHDVNF